MILAQRAEDGPEVIFLIAAALTRRIGFKCLSDKSPTACSHWCSPNNGILFRNWNPATFQEPQTTELKMWLIHLYDDLSSLGEWGVRSKEVFLGPFGFRGDHTSSAKWKIMW